MRRRRPPRRQIVFQALNAQAVERFVDYAIQRSV
jgi:hypothetical protein